LNKEKSRKKDGAGSGKSERGEKRVVEKGFSLFALIITAIICFILGKYFTH